MTISIDRDASGRGCFYCTNVFRIRILKLRAPQEWPGLPASGKLTVLRICASCLDAIFRQHQALRLSEVSVDTIAPTTCEGCGAILERVGGCPNCARCPDCGCPCAVPAPAGKEVQPWVPTT